MPIPTTKNTGAGNLFPLKTYDSEWIRNFSVRAQNATEGSIYIETIAYDSATGEIDPGIVATEIRRPDFWDMVAEVPEAATAMAAVFAAIPKIQEWVAAKELEEAGEE